MDHPGGFGRGRLLGWVALSALVVLQIYALYLAVPTAERQIPYVDKFVHMALFATPAAVAAALRMRWFIGALVLHALVSEPLQAAVTRHRNEDVWDGVADLLGIAVGVAAVRQWRSDRPRLESAGERG
ncbi:MAG: VanZ family protein [Ornithinimicrobium sp.]